MTKRLLIGLWLLYVLIILLCLLESDRPRASAASYVVPPGNIITGSTTNSVWYFGGPTVSGAPDVILDGDIGSDIDDLADAILLHALADNGEVNILATIGCLTNGWNAPVYEMVNRYYGRSGIPVGANTGTTASASTEIYGIFSATNFGSILQDRVAVNGVTNANPATALYRRILSARPNQSVTIVLVGPLSNLSALYNSAADSISPLTGAALITQKVKQLVVVAGIYPHSSGTAEFNISADVNGAQVLMQITGTPIVYCGIEVGNPVSLSEGWQTNYPPASLPYKAWNLSGVGSRPGWGGMALLYAARGTNWHGSNLFYSVSTGTNFIGSSVGSNIWQGASSVGQSYLVTLVNTNDIKAQLNKLIFRAPAIQGGRYPIYRDGDSFANGLTNTANGVGLQLGPNGGNHNAALVVDKQSANTAGAATFRGTTYTTHFHFPESGREDIFINGGNANSIIYLNENAALGGVGVGVPFGSTPNGKLDVRWGGLVLGLNGGVLTNRLYGTATLDFPSTGAQTDTNLTITVTGAAQGDVVSMGHPPPLAGCSYDAWASNDVVYIRHLNASITAKDPASATFKVAVEKYQ